MISLQSKGFSSLLQHHNSKASILWCSAFFMLQLSHPYMTTGKTIALTRWTFVDKVMSLLFFLSRLIITFLPRSGREELPHVQGRGCGGGREELPHVQGRAAAALCWSSREEIPHVQDKRNPSKMVGTETGHRRADRLKPQSQKTSQSDHTDHSLV